MKINLLKFCLISFLGLGFMGIQAQETLPASGGNIIGAGGSVSYTLGQVVYTSSTGPNGSVAQGVQQPYEISVATALETAGGIKLAVSVYPNPSTDFLTLKVENYEWFGLRYQIFDITGKLVEDKKLVSNETSISVGKYLPSTYILRVIEGSLLIKTFNIVKNKGR